MKNKIELLTKPAIYVAAFFLCVPLLVFGILKPSFEKSQATTSADFPDRYVNFKSLSDGDALEIDQDMDIKMEAYNKECAVNIEVWENNSRIWSDTRDFTGSINFEVPHKFTIPGMRTVKAKIFPSGTSPCGSDAKPVVSSIQVYVNSGDLQLNWATPSKDGVSMGKTSFGVKWTVKGLLEEQYAQAGYTLALKDSQGNTEKNISSGALLTDSDTQGTDCRYNSKTDKLVCEYTMQFPDTTIPDGEYNLSIEVFYPRNYIDQPESEGEAVVGIVVDTANEIPVCNNLTVQQGGVDVSEITSGDSVDISAMGTDSDGAVVQAEILFGNGTKYGPADVNQNGVISRSHIYRSTQTKTYTIKAVFYDDAGGVSGVTDECSKKIKIKKLAESTNNCPVITSEPITRIEESSTYYYSLSARDRDSKDSLEYGTSYLPDWAGFDAVTGELTGKPDAGEIGYHSVVLWANDGLCSDFQSYALEVYQEEEDEDGEDGEDGDGSDGEIGGKISKSPSITIINPDEDTVFSCGDSTISWEVTGNSDITKVWIECSTDLEEWVEVVADVEEGETSYEWDVCDLEAGTYYVRVWAEDENGVSGVKMSDPFEIVREGVDSQSPDITDLEPDDGDETTEVKPAVSAVFVSYDSDVDVETVEVKLDGSEITGECSVDGDGFSYTPKEEMSLGEHEVSVKLSDKLGRESNEDWAFTIVRETEKKEINWWLVSGLICGILFLLFVIIYAVAKLIGGDESEEELTEVGGGHDYNQGSVPEQNLGQEEEQQV